MKKILLILLLGLPLFSFAQRNLTGISYFNTALDAGIYISDEDGSKIGPVLGFYQSRFIYANAFIGRSIHDIGERYRYGGELTLITPNTDYLRSFMFYKIDKNYETVVAGNEWGLYDNYIFQKVGIGATYVHNPFNRITCPGGKQSRIIVAPSAAIFLNFTDAPNNWGYSDYNIEAGMDVKYNRMAFSLRYVINLNASLRVSYFIL